MPKVKRRRSRLIGFTDSKADANRRIKALKKEGFEIKSVKREFGGFAIKGLKKKKKR